MANRDFSELAYKVESLVPQAPRPIVIQHLRDAARMVCEKSLAWRYEIPLFNLLPGVHKYSFNAPIGSEVVNIFAVLVNGCPLHLLNLDTAIAQYPRWADLFSGESAETLWSETPSNTIGSQEYNEALFNDNSEFVLPDSIVAEASTPRACTQVDEQQFVILPLPDDVATYETRMFVALKPTREADDMDDRVLDNLEDIIVWGALDTLFSMPAKPWTNPEYAVHYGGKFKEGMYDKKRNANLGHVRGSMGVRMRRWI